MSNTKPQISAQHSVHRTSGYAPLFELGSSEMFCSVLLAVSPHSPVTQAVRRTNTEFVAAYLSLRSIKFRLVKVKLGIWLCQRGRVTSAFSHTLCRSL